MSTPPQVEKELQRLRRLPENRICPNCGKKDSSFGFQAVCMAYKTFVCSDCKSSHQAFSHRCKSVSMSIWNMMEVQSLEERNGGGNKAATKQWLAGAPESMRPRPDSHVDEKKTFVDRAYNKKEWYNKDWESSPPAPCEPAKTVTPQPPQRPVAQQNPHKQGASKNGVSKEPQAGAHGQAALVNLLDDDSFSSAPVTAAPQAAGNAPASSCNLLDDEFFSPQTVPQSTATNAGGSSGSAFSFISGASNNAPTLSDNAPSGSAFSFISGAQSQGNQPTGQVFFDPFATPGSSAPTPQQQQQQQQQAAPCMNAGAGAWQQQPGWQQQQPMGNMGFAMQQQQQQMMNPYAAAPGGCFGQPWQPAASFPQTPQPAMNSGYSSQASANAPTSAFGFIGSSATGPACGITAASAVKNETRSMASNQATSFDPFDPFAPDAISVRG